jgi:hypothetical protein
MFVTLRFQLFVQVEQGHLGCKHEFSHYEKYCLSLSFGSYQIRQQNVTRHLGNCFLCRAFRINQQDVVLLIVLIGKGSVGDKKPSGLSSFLIHETTTEVRLHLTPA